MITKLYLSHVKWVGLGHNYYIGGGDLRASKAISRVLSS